MKYISLLLGFVAMTALGTINTGTVTVNQNPSGTVNISITGASITETDGTAIMLPPLSITNQAVIPASVPPPPVGPSPVVLYTDLASGPNTGGENNQGVYLSVFGKNFGTVASAVHVLVGGVEVNNYRYFGPSLGRTDIQQVTTQVGALGSPALGKPLPVTVTVGGVTSNANVTFTVNPGRILFASLTGNDATAVPGDITHPYRHVQGTAQTAPSAYAILKPGDIMVMRAGNWTDQGIGNYFMRLIYVNGTAPTGVSGTGPLSFMSYPTETVQITETKASGAKGGVSGVDTTGYVGGRYVTLAGLHIESGGDAGVINTQIAADHWRVVNNELTAAGATNTAEAGGITGNGTNQFWVGNHIHNIAGGSSQEMHGIYVDGDGSYEISYNLVENVTGGNGFQAYNDGTNGSNTTNNINLHHNQFDGISKYGINIADGTVNNVVVWDNIVFNTQYSALRFNSNTLINCKVYNNTFYATDLSGTKGYGAIDNDWNFPATALDMENNILYPSAGTLYSGGTVGFSGTIGTVNANLFYGGTGSALGTNPVTTNPSFVSGPTYNFHLNAGSPAIGKGAAAVAPVVTTNFDTIPVVVPFNIGAF